MTVDWLNYHHLLYFKTVVEEGTVSKAAAKLKIGQPTLSIQLRTLESSLGVTLFHRVRNRLVLTDDGRMAFEYASQVFRLGDEMREVLRGRPRLARRANLHLGALDCIPKTVTVSLSRAALAVEPCLITVSEGDAEHLLRELQQHRIDLVLTDFLPRGPESRGLSTRLLARQPVAVFGTRRFAKLKRGFPKSLAGYPWVLPTHHSKLRSDLDRWAISNDVGLDAIAESQDIAVKKMMALHGLGLLAAPINAITAASTGGQLEQIGLLDGVYSETYLLAAERRIASPLVRTLLKTFSP